MLISHSQLTNISRELTQTCASGAFVFYQEMISNQHWCLIYAIILVLCSCKGNVPNKKQPQVDDRMSPLEAYCHGIDYADTLTLHDDKVMTKRMVRIVQLLPKTDSLSVNAALAHFLNGIKHDDKALQSADSLANLYLNNPASPVRNAVLYIQYLKILMATDSIPMFIKERSAGRLKIALLNCPGSIATDFHYLTSQGERLSLHELKSKYTLLVFYDPECPHCSDILKILARDKGVNFAIDAGHLKVLAVYAEGHRDVWERTKGNMPAGWMVGYDLTGVLDNNLYDLPAMPILYLLDSEKRVLLKDPDAQDIVKLWKI